ncbi:MAG TPA: hypothetical protein P5335_00220 [Flavobacterium sp.]|mgnify:CR=1 FL=1|jgi:hypothetical protein|nr:hypothetical protein [Flavobacterium sp.]HQV35062.1 hypothetical protein [Flavobacterium sp.]HQX03263.1 hypothetical protein [Flavobacterium sp.]HRZ30711.1 hypothetical protein [Flavobacterium sp.]HRZ73333.1 hypothetical protein [Flavobacterium sp.]
MKNYVYLIIFMFSINTFGQVTEENDQAIIEKALYSKQEKEDMLAKYKTDVDIIGMTPEVKELYMNLITSNFQKMIILNKDRNNTQKELKQRLKVVLEDQRVELKKLLTYEQIKRHQQIYKPIIESIRFRIDSYK